MSLISSFIMSFIHTSQCPCCNGHSMYEFVSESIEDGLTKTIVLDIDSPLITYRLPDGRVHNPNGPAKIRTYKGVIELQEYWKEGRLNRHPLEGEAKIRYRILYDGTQIPSTQEFYQEGLLDRPYEGPGSGPARILSTDNYLGGFHVYLEEYLQKGIPNRPFQLGPTKTLFDLIDGIIYHIEEWFYKDGNLHRLDGAAHIRYKVVDGVRVPDLKEFFVEGILVNSDFTPKPKPPGRINILESLLEDLKSIF